MYYTEHTSLFCRTIKTWADDRKRGIGPFQTAKMEDTLFVDLTVKLGHPYLYFHQGDCEHIMVFSNIRYEYSILGLADAEFFMVGPN